MGELTILYWRDIPAQIIARAGRRSAKRVLDERFEQAIDRAAMRAGLRGSDAYLEQWRRERLGDCADEDLEATASRVAAELEAAYDDTRLKRLAASGGKDTASAEGPSA